MELFYPYSLIVKGLKCSCRCGLWAILDRKIFRVSREMLGGGASDLSIEIEPGSTSLVWLTLIDSHSWLACVMCSWGSTELGGNKWGRHSWACVGHCVSFWSFFCISSITPGLSSLFVPEGTEAIFINICQFVVASIDISGFSCIDVSVHVFPSLGIVIACLAFLKFMWVAIQLYMPGWCSLRVPWFTFWR